MDRQVTILCGAYNGERYLREQIQSIQRQSFADWRLLIRDDGSRDRTLTIAREMAAADERIEVVDDDLGNCGVAQNFGRLLERALAESSRYFMFADQDDVWHDDKIALSLHALQSVEKRQGTQLPILVHTDLSVVDERLQPIHASFMQFQGLKIAANCPMRQLVVQNVATGCTMMFNRALLELATPIPGGVPIHDWWLASCAAAAGAIEFVPQATLNYRQHSQNQVGARGFWRTLGPAARPWRHLASAANSKHVRTVRQARLLLERLTERETPLNDGAQPVLQNFCAAHAPNVSRLSRTLRVWRSGVRYSSGIKNLLMFYRLLRTSRQSLEEPSPESSGASAQSPCPALPGNPLPKGPAVGPYPSWRRSA